MRRSVRSREGKDGSLTAVCTTQTARSFGALAPVLSDEGQQAGDSQASGARFQDERTGIRAAQTSWQEVDDTTWLPSMCVRQSLPEQVMESHAPVGGRTAGDACDQESKRHGADSSLSPRQNA